MSVDDARASIELARDIGQPRYAAIENLHHSHGIDVAVLDRQRAREHAQHAQRPANFVDHDPRHTPELGLQPVDRPLVTSRVALERTPLQSSDFRLHQDGGARHGHFVDGLAGLRFVANEGLQNVLESVPLVYDLADGHPLREPEITKERCGPDRFVAGSTAAEGIVEQLCGDLGDQIGKRFAG